MPNLKHFKFDFDGKKPCVKKKKRNYFSLSGPGHLVGNKIPRNKASWSSDMPISTWSTFYWETVNLEIRKDIFFLEHKPATLIKKNSIFICN